jgi:protein involved in polysaccharide export with SLBB domain/O-antigen ligase
MSRRLDIIIAWTLVVAIIFSGLAHGAIEPWSLLTLQLIMIPMIGLWALRIVAQRRLGLVIPTAVYPLVGLLLLGIIQAISFTGADGFRNSLSFDVELTRGAVLMVLLTIAAMLVAANFWTTHSRLRIFAIFLTVYGFAFAVFAIIQGLTWTGKFFWLRQSIDLTAPYGPFPSHNNYAGYIELFIPMAVAIALKRGIRPPARLFSAFAAVIMSLSVIFSLSRGGMISLGGALLFIGVAALQSARHRRRVWEAEHEEDDSDFDDYDEEPAPIWRRAPYPQIAMAVIIFFGILVGVVWLGPDKIASRLSQGTLRGSDVQGQNFYGSRGWIWQDTWIMIKANPVIGVGIGAYATAFPVYTLNDGSLIVPWAHNDYLQILADGGVIAGLLAIWFVVAAFRSVIQGLYSRDAWYAIFSLGTGGAVFSLLVHSLFDFNLQIPSTALLFLVLVGITGGLAELRKRRRDPRADQRRGANRLPERRQEADKVAVRMSSSSTLRIPNALSRTAMKTYSLKSQLASLLIVTLCCGSFVPVRAQSPIQLPPQSPVQLPPGQTSTTSRPPVSAPEKSPDTTIKDPSREVVSSRANILSTGDEDYRIGAGDALDIRVADADELSGSLRVRADGTIKMPFLGRMVVLDKTTEGLARDIAEGLRGKYLFEPRVNVNVTDLTSKAIYLQGAIARPGVYQIDGRPHLLQAIVQAGGLLPNHGTTAWIIRRVKVSDEDKKAHEAALSAANEKAREAEMNKPKNDEKAAEQPAADKAAGATAPEADKTGENSDDPKLIEAEWLSKQYTLVKLNINGLFKGNFEQNMFLRPGDIITVPSTDLYFVSGQVKAPGSFALKDGTTLRQALALSQGFTSTASPGKGIIFRENPETGKRTEIPVDMGKVMSGKSQDVDIYANDIVLIPNSSFKQVALPLINMAVYSVLTALLYQALGW